LTACAVDLKRTISEMRSCPKNNKLESQLEQIVQMAWTIKTRRSEKKSAIFL